MNNPTASQKRFMENMRKLGCCVSVEDWHVQIHHMLGRTAKVKGVGNIGHWAILPLSWRFHDVHSNDPLNVTHHKYAFEDRFGTQVDNYLQCLHKLRYLAKTDKSIDPADFPPDNVVKAIKEWRR